MKQGETSRPQEVTLAPGIGVRANGVSSSGVSTHAKGKKLHLLPALGAASPKSRIRSLPEGGIRRWDKSPSYPVAPDHSTAIRRSESTNHPRNSQYLEKRLLF